MNKMTTTALILVFAIMPMLSGCSTTAMKDKMDSGMDSNMETMEDTKMEKNMTDTMTEPMK